MGQHAVNDEFLLTKADALNYRALCAMMAGRQVRRSASRGDRDRLSPARKLAMLQEQDYRCGDCEKPFAIVRGRCPDATLEHVIQFQYGGEANRHNTMLVCRECNLERAKNFSIELVERHYGPIDRRMIDYVPVVSFDKPNMR